MKAVLKIAENPKMKNILMPVINLDAEEIYWDKIQMASLSGGQRTAISWAWCIWACSQVATPSEMRDPFEGFRGMDRDLQLSIISALVTRA
ncbi:MAG: hypothetical protein P4M08_13815 [Oligoflexia bacterium]|nr:hypothetical protein [Oligoflexia bacterium]